MSASPSATTTPDPDDDPPAECPILYGLCTGPFAPVKLLPARQYDSQCAFPTISAPASSNRVTTVASISGIYPSRIELPFIIGTPATMMLSLIANRFPFSGPESAPLIDVFTYHALCVFSSAVGNLPGVRGYFTSGKQSGIPSTTLYASTLAFISPMYDCTSASVSESPTSPAAARSCSGVGS